MLEEIRAQEDFILDRVHSTQWEKPVRRVLRRGGVGYFLHTRLLHSNSEDADVSAGDRVLSAHADFGILKAFRQIADGLLFRLVQRQFIDRLDRTDVGDDAEWQFLQRVVGDSQRVVARSPAANNQRKPLAGIEQFLGLKRLIKNVVDVAQNRIGIGKRCVFSPDDGFLDGGFCSQPKWTRKHRHQPFAQRHLNRCRRASCLGQNPRARWSLKRQQVEGLSLGDRVGADGNLLVAIESNGAPCAFDARQTSGQIPQAARRDEQLSALSRIRLELVANFRASGKFPRHHQHRIASSSQPGASLKRKSPNRRRVSRY